MKYYIINLGCKVNAYETKVMSDLLDNAGYIKGSIDDADIYVINTCFVTNVAEHKSLQMIRKAIRNDHKVIAVCGCLPQMKADLVSEIEGVDIVIGNKDKSKIAIYINQFLNDGKKIKKIYDISNIEFENMCLNNFDRTRAFVKIQDGCNNFCSYCVIPYTRGGLRCKAKKDVIEEVTSLVNNGHKEIVLTGIHTGNYHDGEYDFADLLNDLVKISGLKRLRISSIEITEINDRVIDAIKNSKIIVNHMHIPLQAGSDEILSLMNRKYDVAYFIDKINQIRKVRPLISITTDVIVGFPGETDELFLKTIDTIKKVNFSKLHVFPYSLREGTKAADMPNHVPEEVKHERVDILLNLSKELEMSYMSKFLNETVTFIPEVYKDGYLIGHTDNYLSIKSKGDKSLLNSMVDVKIVNIDYPYCEAGIY